ncbi:MAG TPA: hypothetical protein VN903_22810 [Polyangia bacterium]|nr:hypothetical protein [Polyangia bacterium]
MNGRRTIAWDKVAGVLLLAVIALPLALLWSGRPSTRTASVERLRDDELLARVKPRARVLSQRASNEANLAAPSDEAVAPPEIAPARGPDVPLKADVRPPPSPDAFRVRTTPRSRSADTGLVFSSRPPVPPEGFDKYKP